MSAIVVGDMQVRGSVNSGLNGNSAAFNGVDTSLGKYIANNPLPSATLNALFSDVTGEENALSAIHYACVFVYNSNPLNSYQNPRVWISADVAGGAAVALGVDPTPASPINSTDMQAVQIVYRDNPPVGVVFSAPSDLPSGLLLGTIPPSSVKAFWIRRSCQNTVALSADGLAFSVRGATAAA